MPVKRVLTVVLGVVAGMGLVPLASGPASAAVVTSYNSTTKTLTIGDDDGAHTFTITGSSGAFAVSGPQMPLPGAGSGCTLTNVDTTLACASSDVTTLVVNGNGGADTIRDLRDGAGQGQDLLNGGPGDDTLSYEPAVVGGTLVVDIDGGVGNDLLSKGADNAVLTGGADSDTLNAGTGALRLTDVGGPGNDAYNGGSSGDFFDAAADPGADSYNGGPGVDVVTYAGLSTTVTVTVTGAGDDGPSGEHDTVLGIETVYGGEAADTLTGGPGDESLFGGDGDDLIVGGAGNDTLAGGSGNDDIRSRDGLAGNDQSDCGVGVDRLSLDVGDGFDINCETRIVPTAVRVAAKASAKGKKAAMPVTCPATAATACQGRLVASVKGKVIGKASFRVGTGASAKVPVKLSKKARSTLAKKGKLRVTLRVTAADAVGPLPRTTAKVTLKGAKKRRG